MHVPSSFLPCFKSNGIGTQHIIWIMWLQCPKHWVLCWASTNKRLIMLSKRQEVQYKADKIFQKSACFIWCGEVHFMIRPIWIWSMYHLYTANENKEMQKVLSLYKPSTRDPYNFIKIKKLNIAAQESVKLDLSVCSHNHQPVACPTTQFRDHLAIIGTRILLFSSLLFLWPFSSSMKMNETDRCCFLDSYWPKNLQANTINFRGPDWWGHSSLIYALTLVCRMNFSILLRSRCKITSWIWHHAMLPSISCTLIGSNFINSCFEEKTRLNWFVDVNNWTESLELM